MNDKQTRDPWVEEVQIWLNKTYSGKSGYNDVTVNGKTGWETIYGLIRALQIELGLTPADNFGDGTKAAWDSQVAPNISLGYEGNIVQIIDGANRCKGLGDGKFAQIYSTENITALQDLKEKPDFLILMELLVQCGLRLSLI